MSAKSRPQLKIGKPCPDGSEGRYKVVYKQVVIREEPSTKAAMVGLLLMGNIVHGSPYKVDGEPWLCLNEKTIQELKIRRKVGNAWILIDGASVGLGKLLRRQDEAGDSDSDSNDWIADEMQLSKSPESLHLERLPIELDNGAASQCSLLVIQRSVGAPKEYYVFKASAWWGSLIFDVDVNLLEREYKFYKWLCTPDNLQVRPQGSIPSTTADVHLPWTGMSQASLRNLALQQPTDASSTKSNERLSSFAVDGSPFSRWTSKYEDNQWLSVDLGKAYALSFTEIRWEHAHATTYLIQGSMDGKRWVTLAEETGQPGWVVSVLPSLCKARWVRIYGQKRATEFGFSIFDFKVYERGRQSVIKERSASMKEAERKDAIRRASKERAKLLNASGGAPHLLVGGGLRVPQCLAARCTGTDHEFGLVLELLQEPEWLVVKDDIGVTLEQALAVMDALGRTHAHFMGVEAKPGYDWLPVTALNIEMASRFQGIYWGCFHRMQFAIRQDLSINAAEVCEALCHSYQKAVHKLAEPPLTLCHGDLHLRNIRFSSSSTPVVAAFDWQLTCQSRGAWDFAYFLCFCMPPEERRKCENILAKRYLKACGRASESRSFIQEVRAAILAIMAFYVMIHNRHYRSGQGMPYQVRWLGAAIDDWGCHEFLA